MLINWPLVCFTSHFGYDISQHPFNMSHDGGELLVWPQNVLFNDFFLTWHFKLASNQQTDRTGSVKTPTVGGERIDSWLCFHPVWIDWIISCVLIVWIFYHFLMFYDDFARVFVVRWCYVWFCLNRDVTFKRFIRVKVSWQPIWLQNCMLLYMWINNVNRIFLAIGFIQPMNRTRVFSSHSRFHLSFHLNFWHKEDGRRRIVTITWT